MRVNDVWRFAEKRHTIYLRRLNGVPRELWTDDHILRSYRFCNIYRELDTVTEWLRLNWREPNANDPDLWFAFVVARHMNNVPFLSAMEFPVPWDPFKFLKVAADRKQQGKKVFSGAYMISTNGIPAESKPEYLVEYVFDPMWKGRDKIRPLPGDTLTGWHMALGLWHGLGSFLSAQVIADIKHVQPLSEAHDWLTFCASGPGSRRGLNRVLGRPLNQNWVEDEFRFRVNDLQGALRPHFLQLAWVPPDAQDTQNILCEFDKYERTRLGEGRPKQLFRGGPHAVQENTGRQI